MPFSDPTCHAILSRAVAEAAREGALVSPTVLDCGVGCGLTGKLVKDVLPQAHLVGLEFHAPYVLEDDARTFLRENWGVFHNLYESMIVGPFADFRSLLPNLGEKSFDFVIFGDSIEHVSEEDGKKAIAEARRIAKHSVFLTTPCTYDRNGKTFSVPQTALYGNPDEEHKKLYRREELEELGFTYRGQGTMAFCFEMKCA